MVSDIAYNNNEIMRNERAEWCDTAEEKEIVANLNNKKKKRYAISSLHAPRTQVRVTGWETNLLVQRQIFPKIGRLKIK